MSALLEKLAALKAAKALPDTKPEPIKPELAVVSNKETWNRPAIKELSALEKIRARLALKASIAEDFEVEEIEQVEATVEQVDKAQTALEKILARAKARSATVNQPTSTEVKADQTGAEEQAPSISINGVELNDKQLLAVKLASEGKSFVVTGAAGTGKTTAQAGVVQALDEQDAFSTHDFKYIGEAPSIAIVAFTKVAVRNIQKALAKNELTSKYTSHCMTIHSLLEYEPVQVVRTDPESGLDYETRIFEPQRTAENPLAITHLILEEASMCGIDLWLKLWEALPVDCQIIMLGDINQLQPVFGKPILAYALKKLSVIELTHVYRQALDNPIIANAHRVLKGLPFQSSADAKVALITGTSKVKVGQMHTAMGLTSAFKQLFEKGDYDPETDIILSPWNKKPLGTKAMNNQIATFLGLDRKALIHHIIAGLNEVYLAVGDKVMVEKQFGIITKITENSKYVGKVYKPAGVYTRDGIPIVGATADGVIQCEVEDTSLDFEADYTNFKMEDFGKGNGDGEEIDGDGISKRASSHSVTVFFPDTGVEKEIKSAGEFSYEKFQLGYVLTVHKAQGSEWERVFLIAHYDHAPMLSREFIYTALTRAREQFVCFSKTDLIERACARAEIKGQTLEDKINYFCSNVDNLDEIPCTKTEEDLDRYDAYDLRRLADSYGV